MDTAIRTCPFSHQAFHPRRSNQLYVNAAARISYNNEIAKQKRRVKAVEDKALDKNRSIILRFLGDNNEADCTRDFLYGAGFDFTVLTRAKQIEADTVYCIYDVGYYQLPDGKYKLLRLQ